MYAALILVWELVFRTLVYTVKEVFGKNTNRSKKKENFPPPVTFDNHNPSISVIIPCYNEENIISACILSAINDANVLEVIVCDGGSCDNSLIIVQNLCQQYTKIKILTNGKSRASCQNLGAAECNGSILLFLHADSMLPKDFGQAIINGLQNAEKLVILGAFSFKTDATSWMISLIEFGTNIRSSYLQFPYGDQGIFMYKSIFERLGCFPNNIFLEDFDFVRNARRYGEIITLPLYIVTSARRWNINGVLTNTLKNQVIIWGRLVGFDIDRLASWYYGPSKTKTY